MTGLVEKNAAGAVLVSCHWALQNQPRMGASKPATDLGLESHESDLFGLLGGVSSPGNAPWSE